MNDIMKTKGKLKIMRDHIIYEYATHTMTSRIMNFVQMYFLKTSFFIIFHNYCSYFHIFSFPKSLRCSLLGHYCCDHITNV